MEELLEGTTGACYTEYVDCWTMQLVAIDGISTNAALTEEDITAMEACQGKYWQVGELDGSKVFRQEPAPGRCNGGEFFLFKSTDGWFVSKSLVGISDDTKVAWLGHGEAPNGHVHLPFYRAKKNKHLEVIAQHCVPAVRDEVHIEDDAVVAESGNQKQGGGGWFNKCRRLMELVQAEDWTRAAKLADEYVKHPTMAKVNDERKKRRSDW